METMSHPLYPLARALALCLLLNPFASTQAQPSQSATHPTPAEPVAHAPVRSCRALAARSEQYRDGRYWLQLQGKSVQLYCHDMAGTPREYLELPRGNCSEYASHTQGVTRRVQTCFDKVRIDPETLRVDVSDLTFSTTRKEGRITHDQQVVDAMPFATAMACDAPERPVGRASITLTGTGFAAVDTFKAQGYLAQGGARQQGNGQKWQLQGGGYCGWIAPGDVYNPHYSANWNPFQPGTGFLLQLRVVAVSQQQPLVIYKPDETENDGATHTGTQNNTSAPIPMPMPSLVSALRSVAKRP